MYYIPQRSIQEDTGNVCRTRPSMENDVKNASELCGERTKGLPSQGAEPLQLRVVATRPFEQIHADLCSVNRRHYLVIVDQFSGWPQVVAFPDENTTARRLIKESRQFFTNVGALVKILSRLF